MNYAALVVDIKNWLMRPDLEPYIPSFITMAESRFNRVLRTKEMLARAKVDVTEQYVPLPTDWLKAKNIQRRVDGVPLAFMTLDELDQYRVEVRRGNISAGEGPVFYSYMGEAIELAPSPTEDAPVALEMVYYRKLPPLTANGYTTNWLLKEHYDIYMYSALLHSAPFLKEDMRIPIWKEFADTALAELNASEASGRFSGAPLVMRHNNDMG